MLEFCDHSPLSCVTQRGYVVVWRPSSGYKTENTSSDSRGSPADVSSDKPLIYHTSSVLLFCTTLATRLAAAIFLLRSLYWQNSRIVPVGYNLSFYVDAYDGSLCKVHWF